MDRLNNNIVMTILINNLNNKNNSLNKNQLSQIKKQKINKNNLMINMKVNLIKYKIIKVVTNKKFYSQNNLRNKFKSSQLNKSKS
jgi:hypothetical protein